MKIVKGSGPRNAKLMFIGEAPGAEEIKQGKPFVGRAGKFLNELLKKNRINRNKVYITNVVKIRPPNNRKPTRKEIIKWLPELSREIHTIRPKIIVLLGDTALQAFFPKAKLSRIHGKIIKRFKMVFIPTFHPSAAMRFRKIRVLMEKDFKKINA